MRFSIIAACVSTLVAVGGAMSTQGLVDLVKRRIPAHVNDFEFSLSNVSSNGSGHDSYVVSTPTNGRVKIESNTVTGLASGLHRYLADIANVDIWWYIGSRLHLAPAELPRINGTLTGASIVPWRYHFNTVTFSYTTAFWTWDDWELELDWLALHGVNLPLAWVGVEKIIVDVFSEIGLTDAEISDYLSGPAFQSWNRFGNIQGSWGGELPTSWINGQFELQKKIIQRMVELGMTPVLPSFTGFVPRAITRVLPNATVVNGSEWSGFPTEYTNVTFLEPSDETFTTLQKSFIKKQTEAYGTVSNIYTLDQYNENDPYSGDLDYLKNVTYNTWQSLKAADTDAVWLMQGWLFYSNSDFWTDERVEAYLSGVEEDSDMLILDLFSESQPQWQRTNSYYGKPWIWCQLHGYGGNMGLYGQVENITVNPIVAISNSSSLVGFGLTMEGQEGNEIVYDLLLDQAWASSPIDTETYFYDWVRRRYSVDLLPLDLFSAWDILRTTAYNNTNLTSNAVTKSIFELQPTTYGLTNRTGHHPTTINYDPATLVEAWSLVYEAARTSPSLWDDPAYQYDLVDITRQVLSNAFIPLYNDFMETVNATNSSVNVLTTKGQQMTDLLSTLDSVLLTNEHFSLGPWIASARAGANGTNTTIADFYEYNARNQITLWGPNGEITDYASKSWGGLVSSYYVPRWSMFLGYMTETAARGYAAYNATVLEDRLLEFEESWQTQLWGLSEDEAWGTMGQLQSVLAEAVGKWPDIFGN